MKYNKKELDIMASAVKHFEELEKDINDKINNGYDIDTLYDYIRHINACYIIDWGFDEEYSYIDFDYYEMTLTIVKPEDKVIRLSTWVDIWNNSDLVISSKTIDDVKDIIASDNVKIKKEMYVIYKNIVENFNDKEIEQLVEYLIDFYQKGIIIPESEV